MDTTIKKIDTTQSPKGDMGQKYLVSGKYMSMRLWEREPAGELQPARERSYETLGYVVEGKAELHVEDQVALLNPGDSWLVPSGARHAYKILEPFTAVEVTSPPARVEHRDQST